MSNQASGSELVNDHDPKPLYYQFQAEVGPQFDWEYLEQGPETWRVRIGRRAIVSFPNFGHWSVRASLAFGRNEECGLRCLYHGWKFDVNGNALDMSSEPADANAARDDEDQGLSGS